MKLRFLFLIVLGLITASQASCQIDFKRYMDENQLPLLSLDDYLKVDFKWNMKGTIQAELNEGINNLDEGNVSLAMNNFDKVIAEDSALWVTYYYRGIALKIMNQFKSAVADLKKGIRLNPMQPEIHLELGEVFQLVQHYDEAKKEFDKAIDLKPSMVQSYYSMGSLFLFKGDSRKGMKYYEKCNEIDPKFAAAYMMEGLLRYYAKDYKGSIKYYDQGIQADSTFSQTYFWRGLSNLNLNNSDLCLSDWNRVVRRNPQNSYYVLLRGFLQIELKHFDEAFLDIRKALRGKEVNEDKFVGGQTLLDKQIDLQYAANYVLRSGFGLDEKTLEFVKKGFCQLLAGKMNDALTSLQEAEKLSTSATVFFVMALTYEYRKEHKMAYLYYNKALALDNDIFDAHKKRAVYLSEMKQYKAAYHDLNEMFRLQPESPATYRLRGLIRSNEANYKGAIDDLDKFIKLDSSDLEAYRTRAVCKQMLGDGRGANDDLRSMLRINPEDRTLGADVANNYLILKDTSAAIEVWESFLTEENMNPPFGDNHSFVVHSIYVGDSPRGDFIPPPYYTPYIKLGELYAARKNWKALKKLTNDALPLFTENGMLPRYSMILYWQALVYLSEDMTDAALEKLSNSLKANKDNHAAKYARAKTLMKKGENGKATADLKDLAKINYLDSEALYASMSHK